MEAEFREGMGIESEAEDLQYGNGLQVPQYGLEGVNSAHGEFRLPSLGREQGSESNRDGTWPR